MTALLEVHRVGGDVHVSQQGATGRQEHQVAPVLLPRFPPPHLLPDLEDVGPAAHHLLHILHHLRQVLPLLQPLTYRLRVHIRVLRVEMGTGLGEQGVGVEMGVKNA